MTYRKKQSNQAQKPDKQEDQKASQYIKKQGLNETKHNPVRLVYSKKDFIELFDKDDVLDLSLLGKDKLSLVSMFSQEAKLPEIIEPTAVAEFPHERRGQRPRKESWRYQKQHQPRRYEPEYEEDGEPEWADFDPEESQGKGDFMGRQMTDANEIRQKVQNNGGILNHQDETDHLQTLIDSMLPEQKKAQAQVKIQAAIKVEKTEEEKQPDVERKFDELVAMHQLQQDVVQKVEVEKPKIQSALTNLEKMFEGIPIKTTEKNLLKLETLNSLSENEKENAFSLLMEATNPFCKYLLDGQEDGKCWEMDEEVLKVQNKDLLYTTHADMYVIYKNLKNPNFHVRSEKYTENEFKKFEDFTPKVQLITIGKSQQGLQSQQQYGGAPRFGGAPHHGPRIMAPRPFAQQLPKTSSMPSPSKVQPFVPKARPVAQPQFNDPALLVENPAPAQQSIEDMTNQLKNMIGFQGSP